LTGHVVRANAPVGALVTTMLKQILAVVDDVQPHTTSRLMDACLSLVIAALSDRITHPAAHLSSGRMALLLRAKTFIEENLPIPDLNPKMVARWLGISERYLLTLFQDENMTVREWIWKMRLEKCRQQLSDPLFADRSISEIAFSFGFNSFSHFSHRFKKAFSMTASEFRRRHSLVD
jgi:AraC-like DNA-binding protein